MPVYTYKVRDKEGSILQGQMEALDERDLRRKLNEREFFIIDYVPLRSQKDIFSMDILPMSRRISPMDLSIISWQLHTMLNAGLTLVNSLKTIISQTKNEHIKTVLTKVCARVESGSALWEALKEHPRFFSRFYVQMVNAGEVAGVLDEMLRRLAVYYEREAELRSKVAGALVYPCILLTVSLAVVVFLVTGILPKFSQIFKDIGATIPPPTQFLLNLSAGVMRYWFLVAGTLIGSGVFVKLFLATEKGRYEWERFLMGLPVIGELIKKTVTLRFAQTLATLISGGITILTALEVVTDTINNSVVARMLKHVAASVEEGKPLVQPMEKSKVFPEIVINMIRVGEETGSLDKMLEKIADFYDRDVNNAIASFTKLIEPVMMFTMSVVIGYIAVCIFLPMADLMKSLRGG